MMIGRSVAWLICISVAVAAANDYREPFSTTGSDTGVTLNHVPTDNPEWYVVETDWVLEDMPGSTRVVAGSPAFNATLQRHEVGNTSGQGAVPDMKDPIMRQLTALLSAIEGSQLASAAGRYSEPTPMAGCGQQLAEALSAETATAAAVGAIKHSCDGLRQAAVDFIKDHLGQVLSTQGWADAVRTQPEEMVQLSLLLSERLAATSTPASSQSSVSKVSEDSGHSQTVTTTELPMPTCPNTPLDDDAVSLARSLSEEEKKSKLMEATKEGEVEDLRTLLAAGASPEARDIYRRTALHWAAWNGFAKVARCLLDAGADVDSKDNEDYQPLHFAAIGGDPVVVRMLVARGANANARDSYGWTPLHLTVRERHPEAALALLEVGADREVRNEVGRTPMDEARKRDSQLLINVLTES